MASFEVRRVRAEIILALAASDKVLPGVRKSDSVFTEIRLSFLLAATILQDPISGAGSL